VDLGNKRPAKTKDAAVSENQHPDAFEVLLSTSGDKELSSVQVLEGIAGIINRIRRNNPDLWQQILNEVRAHFFQVPETDTACQEAQPEIASELEQTYEALEISLREFRQAVAMAVAMEKRLEQELQKARDQASTWANRAATALKKGNVELHKEAQERQLQYAEAARQLDAQLGESRVAATKLRRNLTDAEISIQKVYTDKTILRVRENAANAHIRANHLIASLDVPGAMERLKRIENRVLDLEEVASTSHREHGQIHLDVNAMLVETTAALERSTRIIAILEDKLLANAPSQQTEMGK
jgi:phage shock protein A